MEIKFFKNPLSSQGLEKQLNTSVLVQVNILDLNDNEPVITYSDKNGFVKDYNRDNQTLVLAIDENLIENLEIMRFSSDDIDSSPNSNSIFYLRNSQQDKFKLSLNGSLMLIKKLDAEKSRFYKFEIICENLIVKPETKKSKITVIVHVNDINDNCPVESSSIPRRKFILKNVFDVNESLFKLNFTDIDVDPNTNSKLKFQLMSHTTLFDVYQDRVYLQRKVYEVSIRFKQNFNLSLIQLGKYDIKLRVSDHGQPTACEYQDVFSLFVGDSNLDLLSIDDVEYKLSQINDSYQYHRERDKIDQLSTTQQVLLLKTLRTSNNSRLNYIIVLVAIMSVTIFLVIVSFLLTIYFYSRKRVSHGDREKASGTEDQPVDHHSVASCDLNSYTSSSLTKDTKLSSICSDNSADRNIVPVQEPHQQPETQFLTTSAYLMKLTERIKIQQHFNNLNLKSFNSYNRRSYDEKSRNENEEDKFLCTMEPSTSLCKGYFSSDV